MRSAGRDTMTLRVRLFAMPRERAGRDELDLELERGATVADALAELSRQPALADLLERLPARLAVNLEVATGETPLREATSWP